MPFKVWETTARHSRQTTPITTHPRTPFGAREFFFFHFFHVSSHSRRLLHCYNFTFPQSSSSTSSSSPSLPSSHRHQWTEWKWKRRWCISTFQLPTPRYRTERPYSPRTISDPSLLRIRDSWWWCMLPDRNRASTACLCIRHHHTGASPCPEINTYLLGLNRGLNASIEQRNDATRSGCGGLWKKQFIVRELKARMGKQMPRVSFWFFLSTMF